MGVAIRLRTGESQGRIPRRRWKTRDSMLALSASAAGGWACWWLAAP
jgi:hypothetical protein